jgi:hypothetical protein
MYSRIEYLELHLKGNIDQPFRVCIENGCKDSLWGKQAMRRVYHSYQPRQDYIHSSILSRKFRFLGVGLKYRETQPKPNGVKSIGRIGVTQSKGKQVPMWYLRIDLGLCRYGYHPIDSLRDITGNTI